MNAARAGVVILISGRGSNLQAIIEAVGAGQIPADIKAVICNNPRASGLAIARAAGIPTHIVDHHDFSTREQFDQALIEKIDAYRPQLVLLAGFMRLLSADFIDHYAWRLLNIHPSLLPAFPGLNTHARVLQSGATYHGATVHFVTHEMDCGPVIVQATVPVAANDTAETLAARVLKEEHRIYPLAIRWFLQKRLSIQKGRVLLDDKLHPEQGLTLKTP